MPGLLVFHGVALAVPPGHIHLVIKETVMDDVLYLGLTALFFALALAVLKGVDRL
jgi:hypothetical protein